MTRFLTVDELVYINEQLPARAPIHTLLKGKQKVRDMDLLEAAVGRPSQTVFGADAYPALSAKATALLHSVARNHPFADGNKRTATVAALFMLDVNGQRVTWEAPQALARILALAEGRAEVDDFAAWLVTEPCAPAPEPDAERDTAIIARLLAEHAWLLEQLAQR